MIFSGDESTQLWKDIHKVYKKKKLRKLAKAAGLAIYSLGCRCQELEAEVERLKKKLEEVK